MKSLRQLEFLPLRVAVAACFLCHGILALKNATIYYSEWNVWLQGLFPAPGFLEAKYFLWTAGIADVLTAVSMLRREIPRVAFAWGILWGLLTSLARLYFLGSLQPPLSHNIVHPLAEVLMRAPNWIMPLLLYMRMFRRRGGEGRWISAGVLALAAALLLTYLVDLESGRYPIAMVRIGEPLWFFHLCGILAALSVLAIPAGWLAKPDHVRAGGMALAAASYLAPEAFTVFMVNAPHGIAYAGLLVGEHLPTYLCLYMGVRTGASQERSREATS